MLPNGWATVHAADCWVIARRQYDSATVAAYSVERSDPRKIFRFESIHAGKSIFFYSIQLDSIVLKWKLVHR